MQKDKNRWQQNLKAGLQRSADPKQFHSKAFQIGSYSVSASFIVLAIAIAVVMLVNRLPTKYTQLDMTQNRLFSLSEQTEKLVSSLTEPVEIYLLAQSGEEDTPLQQLLSRYEDLSDQVSVTVIDPVANPGFSKQYTTAAVSNNSVIVVSGSRSQLISYGSIYVTDYSNYSTTGTYSTSFDGESSLTSAIDYVTSENLPTMYRLSGHGESVLSSTMTTAIAKENINLADLSLLTVDGVPADTACLLIYAPTSDLSADEKSKLLSYLQNGGNLMLFTTYSETELPNLAAVMAYYGTAPVNGLILEEDANYFIRGYSHYLLPEINYHEITAPLQSGGYYVLAPYAHGITILADLRDTLSVTKLLTTTDRSYAKMAGYQMTTTDRETTDQSGPFAVGVAVTETIGSVETQIVWYATSNLLDDTVNQTVSGANQDLFLNSINWMCGREDSITIHSKSLTKETLTIPSGMSARLSFVFIGIIPLSCLAAGFSVWRERKRK
ncbi:MAG: GldG family protein [Negativicutes bacterium]|nr:GldG family protein [Negativicutes bacterium]